MAMMEKVSLARTELFLVVKGRFRMELTDRHVWLEEGERIGNVTNERTVVTPEVI